MESGYNIGSRNPFGLMRGRLGVYEKKPFKPMAIDGINHQSKRFLANGGNLQQERMIRDKRRSLDHAVMFSYQGAEIAKIDDKHKKPIRALINPNKVKQDYDEKILSVGYEHEFKTGDVFEWLTTHSHWLIYLQDLTELAYFRANIRRCEYEIQWEDDGLHRTYVSLKGPIETRIDYIQKHGISIDNPNWSLTLLIPKNSETIKFCQRYTKFYLQDDPTCWRIEGVDKYSTPGIIEVTAVEYYANKDEDDIENGLVGTLIKEEEDPNPPDIQINGETFIKPKIETLYSYNSNDEINWFIDPKYPVEWNIVDETKHVISVKWTNPYSGQFIIKCNDQEKTVVVESLF